MFLHASLSLQNNEQQQEKNTRENDQSIPQKLHCFSVLETECCVHRHHLLENHHHSLSFVIDYLPSISISVIIVVIVIVAITHRTKLQTVYLLSLLKLIANPTNKNPIFVFRNKQTVIKLTKSSFFIKIMSTINMNNYISTFEHDVNISLKDKFSVLKMLKTIVTNLSDPIKSQDMKYRQLRLQNIKISTMVSYPSIVALLQSIGFQKVFETDEELLKILPITYNPIPSATIALSPITAAYNRIASHQLQRSGSGCSTGSSFGGGSSVASGAENNEPPLTEKQKARILAEEAEIREKEEARLARKRTSAQIKADKHVRENDPNWKPSVNAAAAKTGSSILTFRDKFGEGEN